MPSPRWSASVIASKTQLTTSSARAFVRSVRRAERASINSLFVIPFASPGKLPNLSIHPAFPQRQGGPVGLSRGFSGPLPRKRAKPSVLQRRLVEGHRAALGVDDDPGARHVAAELDGLGGKIDASRGFGCVLPRPLRERRPAEARHDGERRRPRPPALEHTRSDVPLLDL